MKDELHIEIVWELHHMLGFNKSIISSFDENIEQICGVIRFVQLNRAKCAMRMVY
jgi:hypothetical protein